MNGIESIKCNDEKEATETRLKRGKEKESHVFVCECEPSRVLFVCIYVYFYSKSMPACVFFCASVCVCLDSSVCLRKIFFACMYVYWCTYVDFVRVRTLF